MALPLTLIVAFAARDPAQEAPPRQYQDAALVELHQQMVADKHGSYGAADGGGSARVVIDGNGVAGRAARYVLEYTAGELGIAAGGSIFFQVSPFWHWSTPQTEEPRATGFTRVSTDAAKVTLEPEVVGQQCLRIAIAGAALPAGAKVTIDYGCGERGARVDSFRESEEAFYFWVDGDGDGTRKLIGADPHISIEPGPAVDLIVTAPSELAIGAEFDLALAFVDVAANAAREFAGAVELAGEGFELPPKVEFKAGEPAHRRVRVRATEAGVRSIAARILGGERSTAPILVSERPRRLLWADLHGHSSLSDGTATPEEFYDYARDVAALDVAVLTDHDHWGMRKFDQEPQLWQRIRTVTASRNDPGRFTTLLGYEWTSWLYGHRHVLYFEEEGDVLSSVDAATESPEGLWAALRERKARAITIPHHPGGGPVPVDWSIPPDPDFEPVVEIASVHGTSEEPRGPRAIYKPRSGHFARDALAKGYRLGFVGSGDTHNGHPGLGHLGEPCGGLAAILASDNTRDAVEAALKARQCYATTGPRILLWFGLGTSRMGSIAELPPATAAAAQSPAAPSPESGTTEPAPAYFGRVIGTGPIARLEVVKNGEVVVAVAGEGRSEVLLQWRDDERKSGDWVYLRAIQEDRHAAWASPIFTE